ncbi:SAM-dependent methyltransferase [Scytonema sp. NUACC21]
MSVKLKKIVLWGRSLQEYIKMFDLTAEELKLTILDCGGGPSSFNTEMAHQGHQVYSCDPIYQFTASEIEQRIQETYPIVIEAARANEERFVWKDIESVEHLGVIRLAAMQKFLEDFPLGVGQGRYVVEELPALSFNSNQFDLSLCSHLLFTYSEQLSFDFHLASIQELCRVAKEVRVFPVLVNYSGETSPHLHPVMTQLSAQGYQVELKQVSYEFQRGGNQLLRVYRSKSDI